MCEAGTKKYKTDKIVGLIPTQMGQHDSSTNRGMKEPA